MTAERGESWSWRDANASRNPGLRLLYEPGNWGDILKGAWSLIAAAKLGAACASGVLRYLDAYAGAPTYPLTAAARARHMNHPLDALREAQAPYAARDELASTALLIRDSARNAGAAPMLEVFDADANRRDAWRTVPEAEVLEAASGEQALQRRAAAQPQLDLILVDPYDLVDRPAAALEPSLPGGEGAVLLLYAYNKSPRGGGFERAYRSFRRRLERRIDRGRRAILGSVPSDAVLPRAFHEVILIAPRAFVDAVKDEACDATRRLARHLQDSGSFEEIDER